MKFSKYLLPEIIKHRATPSQCLKLLRMQKNLRKDMPLLLRASGQSKYSLIFKAQNEWTFTQKHLKALNMLLTIYQNVKINLFEKNIREILESIQTLQDTLQLKFDICLYEFRVSPPQSLKDQILYLKKHLATLLRKFKVSFSTNSAYQEMFEDLKFLNIKQVFISWSSSGYYRSLHRTCLSKAKYRLQEVNSSMKSPGKNVFKIIPLKLTSDENFEAYIENVGNPSMMNEEFKPHSLLYYIDSVGQFKRFYERFRNNDDSNTPIYGYIKEGNMQLLKEILENTVDSRQCIYTKFTIIYTYEDVILFKHLQTRRKNGILQNISTDIEITFTENQENKTYFLPLTPEVTDEIILQLECGTKQNISDYIEGNFEFLEENKGWFLSDYLPKH